MSFRHRPLMTSVYEWYCSHACTSALVMGRTPDLPSVIELTPCKYKRVYFYFGVQKKLIFIYLFFFLFLFFWGRFDFHFEADLTGNLCKSRSCTFVNRPLILLFTIKTYIKIYSIHISKIW